MDVASFMTIQNIHRTCGQPGAFSKRYVPAEEAQTPELRTRTVTTTISVNICTIHPKSSDTQRKLFDK
jgi:hypothetical protein